jgi:hypothetical protein
LDSVLALLTVTSPPELNTPPPPCVALLPDRLLRLTVTVPEE